MNRPLHVLRVITWMPVGGIERKIVAVLPRLDPARFRASLVCIREKGPLADELERQGVPVHLCPLRTRLSPSGILKLARLMRRERVDIVHAHMYRASVPATIAAHLAGVPTVVSQVHNVGTWETRRQRWMDRFLCRWRQAIVGVSEEVRRDILENLDISAEMTRVIYNGVDLAEFQLDIPREVAKRKTGIDAERIVVVYHGRLVDQKNPRALVDLAACLKRHASRPTTVLVAGDGPRRNDLENLANESNLADAIRFLGQRDDIPFILAAGDIAVLPSLKEGFSNALVEAMAAGLPAVATAVGGNAEAVADGQSGFIVEPGDTSALCERVLALVDDEDLRDRMRKNAKQRVRRFSLDRMIEEVENLYTDLSNTEKYLEGSKKATLEKM